MDENELNEMLTEAYNNGFNDGHQLTKDRLVDMLRNMLDELKHMDAGDV